MHAKKGLKVHTMLTGTPQLPNPSNCTKKQQSRRLEEEFLNPKIIMKNFLHLGLGQSRIRDISCIAV
jgi:hypothetical protein